MGYYRPSSVVDRDTQVDLNVQVNRTFHDGHSLEGFIGGQLWRYVLKHFGRPL